MITYLRNLATDLPSIGRFILHVFFPLSLPEPENYSQKPILFIHGYVGFRRLWSPAFAYFRSQGFTHLYAYSYLKCWHDLHQQADQQLQSIEKIRKQSGDQKVTLVGHSMGGLIAGLCALKRPEWIDQIILICSPVQGTKLAKLVPFGRATEQMENQSEFSRTFCQNLSQLKGIRVTFFLAERDEIVLPQENSFLPPDLPHSHREIRLSRHAHISPLFDAKVFETIFNLVNN